MTDLYGRAQRDFQDRFDTRRLADRVGQIIIHSTVDETDRAFIVRSTSDPAISSSTP